MNCLQYHTNKTDISTTKFATVPVPDPVVEGDILLEIEKFALTANNITYAVMGDTIGYWSFFPAPEPWGIVPVWGVGKVIASASEQIQIGERLYGFLPCASHLVLSPGKIRAHSFTDIAQHRAALPPIYNQYSRLGSQPASSKLDEDIQMLLQPLFATSFLIHDFFTDQNCFGARNIILGSASSKTAIGVARLFASTAADNYNIIGLTSEKNMPFVRELGDYDQVLSYQQISDLPLRQPSVYIDMSGNAAVQRALHNHLSDQLVYSCAVGLSHWQQFGQGEQMLADSSDHLPGAKPRMFFAPDQAIKRQKDWGGTELQHRIDTALQAWASTNLDWLQVAHATGTTAVEQVFAKLREGTISPKTGYTASLLKRN